MEDTFKRENRNPLPERAKIGNIPLTSISQIPLEFLTKPSSHTHSYEPSILLHFIFSPIHWFLSRHSLASRELKLEQKKKLYSKNDLNDHENTVCPI